MRIAFTHNLKQSSSEEDAEFDTPETVAAIVGALRNLGHLVSPVEVSGPPSRVLARLESMDPDLVFNTAEGRVGRYREAFYPGVFEQLGVPFTGSDAYVCTLTLDKDLTKRTLAQFQIPTPESQFFTSAADARFSRLRYPVILKPNFEGSSKGITQSSVVENSEQLFMKLKELLKTYPAGILAEEYIVGKDVTVPFIEGISPETGGVLMPAEYIFAPQATEGRKYAIYDYDLKNKFSDWVDVRCPADLPPEVIQRLRLYAGKVFKHLGCRDFARADFRIMPDGAIYFIEVNALPSLEPGAGLYASAALFGLDTVEKTLDAILQSSMKRHGIRPNKERARPPSRLRVGFTYNEKRVTPVENGEADHEAEYDAPKTLEAIRSAIRALGHEVVDFEATGDLPARLGSAHLDVVFNIAEGLKGRNREAHVPAILELLGVPYTGSDPATLALTLDKSLAKKIVKEAGVAVPRSVTMITGKEALPKDLGFPLIVKPLAEGSSKGVTKASVVHDETELRALVNEMVRKYRQPAMVEEFVSGREFTVALLGETRPKVLPPMEIVFTNPDDKFPVYSFAHKIDTKGEVRYQAPADLDPALKKKIQDAARKAFMALGCRDVARIDLRLDAQGEVRFIECNPLPGLTPGWSDLCLIAEASGIAYTDLIQEILSPAIRRLKEQRRELLQNQEAKPHAQQPET